MNRVLAWTVVAAFLFPSTVGAVTRSPTKSYNQEGVKISLRDPVGSVYKEGEEVGFTVRTGKDAYVVVFDIDTQGFVHLLYPADGKSVQKFSRDRAYELPEGPEPLVVEGPKGLEFVFAVAVEDRGAIDDDELHFLARNETLPEDRRFRVTGDPFLAANRVMSQLIRGTSLRRDATISFTYFYVEEAVDFPRYLCEDCYDKGRDPYAPGMPTYVAVADFQKTDGLAYPLREGFALEKESSARAEEETQERNVTKVYVTYYPRWDDGFYATSWWYLDPWYWDIWYWDPWYPRYSGFYVGIGWSWGWWGWGTYHYRYFPYYYIGPYYAVRPWWGYYNCYPDYWWGLWYPAPVYRWRSYGVVHKGHRTTTLYTAMNQRTHREFGLAPRVSKSFDATDRRIAATKSFGEERSLRSFDKRRVDRATDARVIRSKPLREAREVRAISPRESRETREIRSGKGSYREQRVITRPPGTKRVFEGERKPAIDTKRSGGKSFEIERRPAERRQPQIVPDATRGKPGGRGAYAPNVRRGDSGKTPPAPAPAPARSSPPPSKPSSPSKGRSADSQRERR